MTFRSGVHKAKFSRASGHTGRRTKAVVASVGVLEVGARLALLLRNHCCALRFGRWLVEVAEHHGAGCDSVLRTETIVASIGTLERWSRYAFGFRCQLLGDVTLRFGIEEAEFHRASSDSGRTTDAIIASIGTLERRSRGALVGCWLHGIR